MTNLAIASNADALFIAESSFNDSLRRLDIPVSIETTESIDDTVFTVTVNIAEHDNYSYDCKITFDPVATVQFYDSENDTTTEYPSVFHLFTHLAADLAYNFDD